MNKLKVGDKVYLGTEEWEVVGVDKTNGEYSLKNESSPKLWITGDGRLFPNSAPIFSLSPYTVQNFTPLYSERFEEGQLVFVRSDESRLWEARFYSHFGNGKYYCFINQEKEGVTISWEYITSKID